MRISLPLETEKELTKIVKLIVQQNRKIDIISDTTLDSVIASYIFIRTLSALKKEIRLKFIDPDSDEKLRYENLKENFTILIDFDRLETDFREPSTVEDVVPCILLITTHTLFNIRKIENHPLLKVVTGNSILGDELVSNSFIAFLISEIIDSKRNKMELHTLLGTSSKLIDNYATTGRLQPLIKILTTESTLKVKQRDEFTVEELISSFPAIYIKGGSDEARLLSKIATILNGPTTTRLKDLSKEQLINFNSYFVLYMLAHSATGEATRKFLFQNRFLFKNYDIDELALQLELNCLTGNYFDVFEVLNNFDISANMKQVYLNGKMQIIKLLDTVEESQYESEHLTYQMDNIYFTPLLSYFVKLFFGVQNITGSDKSKRKVGSTLVSDINPESSILVRRYGRESWYFGMATDD